MSIAPYPLCWPPGFPRTPQERKKKSAFKATLATATRNVAESLTRFGVDSGARVTNVVATTNVGGIVLGERASVDPGVAVWFEWDGAMRCIAVDRYPSPAENLQAIHHILEARRSEVRHGGIVIARSAFRGFLALPPPEGQHWHEILGVKPEATREEIEAAYKAAAKSAHPDLPGGDDTRMAELNSARRQALSERGA